MCPFISVSFICIVAIDNQELYTLDSEVDLIDLWRTPQFLIGLIEPTVNRGKPK